MNLPIDVVIRRVVRHPTKAHNLDAPQLVRILRRVMMLHTARKLGGQAPTTGYEPAIAALMAAAKRRGVIWNAEEQNLIRGNEDEHS
jgi:hypothetical protein